MFVWNIDPNFFFIPDWVPMLGGRGIRYYGVLYAMTIMGGFYFWRWQCVRGGLDRERSENFLTWLVVAVIVGARLGHCLFYEPERYLADPIRIFYFWEGGLASHGSTIALIAVLIWFAKKESIPIREALDRFSMSAAVGASLIRFGNFMNSEIVGRPWDGALSVKFPRYEFTHGRLPRLPCETDCGTAPADSCGMLGEHCLSFANVISRHPSQLYEGIMGALVLVILLIVDRAFGGEKRPLGLLGFTFIFVYFLGRFLVEFVKEFQSLQGETSLLTMGQYLSIPFMAIGFIGIYDSVKRARKAAATS